MTTEEKARRYDLLMVQIRADIAFCREQIASAGTSIFENHYNGLILDQYHTGRRDAFENTLIILNKLKELMNE